MSFHSPRLAPLAAALALVLLSACQTTAPGATAPAAAASTSTGSTAVPAAPVEAFFARFAEEWMLRQPSAATGSRYFDGEVQQRMDRQLTPLTREHREGTVALARRGLLELGRFDRGAMTDAQRVSAELMEWQLQTLVVADTYAHSVFPLQQFSGPNVTLPSLMTVVHPLRNARDADNYLSRLGQFEARMGEAVDESRAQAARGILPPRFILQATIEQMRKFVSGPASANPLVSTLGERLAKVDTMDAAAREAVIGNATAIVGDEVYPAWREAIAVLESQLPASTDDAGLWRFDDGAEIYAFRLREFTSTKLSAQQIHQLGLSEVARIEGQMDQILRSLGRTEGTVKARVETLRKDLAYADTAAGRAALMADIETMMRDAERRAEGLFDVRPRSAVIAQPYPEYQWPTAAASYTAPPLDGSRPGVYQMPLRPDRLSKFGLRTLVYHETVPGHHFQVALSVENQALPRFRQTRAFGGISAFSEGWALYAERLAVEEGWYEGDPEGLLGQLDAELFRARRLVVDTGLHAMRWTRQQAIDYGIPPSEVDRYVVMPGQATSYKVGQLEMIRLRDHARASLGDRYDPREFHNRVLLTGTVPLNLLEREIEAYIRDPG